MSFDAELRGARRVLRPGGRLFAATISRFASLIDGLRGALFEDEAFRAIVREDLASGRHVNRTGRLEYFTTAYFHRPEELEEELAEAGFLRPALHAIEGPAALLADFERRWAEAEARAILLDAVRQVEGERSLLGASPHWMAIARRP